MAAEVDRDFARLFIGNRLVANYDCLYPAHPATITNPLAYIYAISG